MCISLAVQTLFSAGGGIGIRVRLRGACLTAWGFESPPAHDFNPDERSGFFCVCIFCRTGANNACAGSAQTALCAWGAERRSDVFV